MPQSILLDLNVFVLLHGLALDLFQRFFLVLLKLLLEHELPGLLVGLDLKSGGFGFLVSFFLDFIVIENFLGGGDIIAEA